MKVSYDAPKIPMKQVTLMPAQWRRVAENLDLLGGLIARSFRKRNHGGYGEMDAEQLEDDIMCAVAGLHYIAEFCADKVVFATED